jgi:NAD(P)-dependent dehydrogenase (short-subunit alcohol dehydrogenase family)
MASLQAVIPHMVARRWQDRLYGFRVQARGSNLAHYVAAKHGVIGLVRALAIELAEYGINVNAICPTAMDTPIIHNQVNV